MKHIFLQGKGKYRISWCWVTAREELQIWCCSFLPPPQLMQFSGFPLRCRLCPTFGHSTDCGDTPKYINSHTRSETHWFVPKYPVSCEKDRLHKSSPAHNEHFLPSKEYIHDLGTFYEEGDGRLTPDVS